MKGALRMSLLETAERQCTKEEGEITMYYELYLDVKATATKRSVLYFHSSIFVTGVSK